MVLKQILRYEEVKVLALFDESQSWDFNPGCLSQEPVDNWAYGQYKCLELL